MLFSGQVRWSPRKNNTVEHSTQDMLKVLESSVIYLLTLMSLQTHSFFLLCQIRCFEDCLISNKEGFHVKNGLYTVTNKLKFPQVVYTVTSGLKEFKPHCSF